MFADNTPWEMPELPGEVSVLELAWQVSMAIYVAPPRVWTVRIGGAMTMYPSSGVP